MEILDIKEVADRLEKKVGGIRGWLKQKILVLHDIDHRTGRKLLFFWPCVDVRRHFVRTLRLKRKSNTEIADALNKVFGDDDRKLKAFLTNFSSTEEVKRHFEKIFAKLDSL